MTKKNKLQHNVFIYRKRRDAIRAKYGTKKDWCGNEQYKKEVATINKSIRNWLASIRILDNEMRPIRKASKMVCKFMGISKLYKVGVVRKSDTKTYYAVKLFCAYCLDHEMSGSVLADFLGIKHYKPTHIRMYFKKTFLTNEAHYKLWKDFKKFVKDYELTFSENSASSKKD